MMRKEFIKLLFLSVIISLLISSCNKDEDKVADEEKVVCKIIQPNDNDTIRLGEKIKIIVEADYSLGIIEQVHFYIDGIGVGSTAEFPYTYEWDSGEEEVGWHYIKSEAKAGDGKTGVAEHKILLVGDLTKANAGEDVIIDNGSRSVTLSANEPNYSYEKRVWTIESGEGGSFSDASKPDAIFTGNINTSYLLKWTISNKYEQSSDEVIVAFKGDVDYGSLTDIDGNTYKTVMIGGKEWMAENLRVTHFADGSDIRYIISDEEWDDLEDINTAYCYYENNVNSEYGVLYTYNAAKRSCPEGWHLPTKEEWEELECFLSEKGNVGQEGLVLKSVTGWSNEGNGTDIYGFTGLPGGERSRDNGRFYDEGKKAIWWSATERDDAFNYTPRLLYDSHSIVHLSSSKADGLSVRCVRD